MPVFLLQIYYTTSLCLVCKLNAQFEQECNQTAQYSSCRYRTCPDTLSDLYKECEIHQTADNFDLYGIPNTNNAFAFYREVMLLLLVFYSWEFYKYMVEWIDEDAKHTLNHTKGKTYSSLTSCNQKIAQKDT